MDMLKQVRSSNVGMAYLLNMDSVGSTAGTGEHTALRDQQLVAFEMV